MGSLLSIFQSNIYNLNSNINSISDSTKKNIAIIFDLIEKNPKILPQNIEHLLATVPRNESLIHVYDKNGYNLIQNIVGINNTHLLKWILSQRKLDVNRGACSLPLHIACLKGHEDCVELLLKNGARTDVEARMCYPGPHNQNCEQRAVVCCDLSVGMVASDKLQTAIYYAIDGDQVDILELLMQQADDNWLPWQNKKPLLNIACEKGAWECVKYLVLERSEEINHCCDDEYYPIHHCSLQDNKFLELLISNGADITVKTCTQQMTVLHVLFLLGKKSAEDTLEAVKILLNAGLKEFINTADTLGNTPLHALIVRYALEEARYGYNTHPAPWGKYEMLLIARYLLQNGGAPSINQPGNSALACVLRQVRDWEFRYELLDMLLVAGGNPNLVGRDGSVPLMVCLVPLINKDPLHHFTHTMKVFYLNCVRLLCRYGANPNCHSRSNLTPLHVLMFSASENTALSREKEKAAAFAFIKQLLIILLQHGLDPNVRFSQRTQHILLSLMDMVQNARSANDLDYVCDLTLTLLQHGADPNVNITTTEPMICHSQSSVFLKKCSNQVLYYYVQLLIRREELLVINPPDKFTKLLWIYYYAMQHRELYSCLKILYTQTSLIPMKDVLVDVLRYMYTHPRTLKQLCRVSVYSSLGRKSQQKINKLPIPPIIRDYILTFEP